MRYKEFVVDFRLPDDDDFFVHHGTNVVAQSAAEAKYIFLKHFPAAEILGCFLGVCMLYGKPYCTWDAAGGAECSSFGS